MKTARGWAFPDADEFMLAEMKGAGENGSYQYSHLRIALEHVSDWTAAVDGGAHVGTWTRLLAARFARVLAVEPSPDTREGLVANMAAFGCANVEIVAAAMGAEPGDVSLAMDPRAETLKNTGARYVHGGGPIERITLDSLALPSLGFLKLDVEGSEPLALLGGLETLKRCRPVVLWENKGFCRRFGFRPEAPAMILTKAGYRELAIAGCDRVWGPR